MHEMFLSPNFTRPSPHIWHSILSSENNNNNNNVNIQNSNNNQNNDNMVMAGRRLPLQDVLKLQERLSKHYRDTAPLRMNETMASKVSTDKIDYLGNGEVSL